MTELPIEVLVPVGIVLGALLVLWVLIRTEFQDLHARRKTDVARLEADVARLQASIRELDERLRGGLRR